MYKRHRVIISHLEAALYGAPPRERLGVMKRILDCAAGQDIGFRGAYADRFDSEGQPTCAPKIWKTTPADLSRVLTDPRLLREPPRPCGRTNIAKAANAYVQMFFGVSIQTYLQRIRAGEDVVGIAVSPTVDHGSVPNLRKKLTEPTLIIVARRCGAAGDSGLSRHKRNLALGEVAQREERLSCPAGPPVKQASDPTGGAR